jgi:hypothetical protein
MKTTATPNLIILHPLEQLWPQGWWKHWHSERRYTIPHNIQSLWQWYLDYHKDHTVGQSEFHVEESHHHGLREHYFMHCIAAHDISLPLHQSLCL